MRWVDSRCRSRLLSSSFTSCTCPCSRSRWRSSRSRSARISSNRRRDSSRSGVPWACAGAMEKNRTVSAPSGAAGQRGSRAAKAHRKITCSRRKPPPCPAVPLSHLHMSQMPPHAHQAPGQAEEHPENDDDDHVLRGEEQETGKGPPALVPKEEIAGVAENQGEKSAQQSLQRAFQQERAPDEPVGCAHQPHNGDLPGSLENGEPDSDADDHHCHRGKREADHQTHQTGDVAEIVELLHPLPAVAHIIDEPEALEPLGHPLDRCGIAKAILEPDLDGRGERIDLEIAIGIAKLHQLIAGSLQRLLFADVADVLHLGKRGDVLGGDGDGLGRGSPQNEPDDLDPLLQAFQCLAQVQGDQAKETDGEEREGDGGDGERGEERGPAERQERLAGEQLHFASAWASSTWLSYTTLPSRISMIR